LKAFDLLVLIALLITAYSGFKNGFIQTIFKTIGYIAGGVVGVAIAVEVMNTWSSNLAKAAGAIIFIIFLATTGEYILGKIGLGFRKVLFISPLKFLDSLLGATLAALRTVFITYLLSVILIATPWSIGDKYISNSQFYKYTDSYLPKVVTELKNYGDKLFKQISYPLIRYLLNEVE
jgi:uncharacterized membrane protein required for colicin V production